jgi:hypothetical protein
VADVAAEINQDQLKPLAGMRPTQHHLDGRFSVDRQEP